MRELAETHPDNKDAHFEPLRLMERLPEAARSELESLMHVSSYPPNRIVFSEGEPAAGLYFVLEGEVRVSLGSADGRHLNLRIARKGELLGLSSVLASGTYNATAETLYPSRLAYIKRAALLAFLSRHPGAYQALVEELSRKFSTACEQLKTVALSHSALEKLARLLLDWSENGKTTSAGTRFRFSMTHEEIGEFIGASRETVTRALAQFRRRELVKFQGSMLTIPNREALARYTLG